MAQVRKFGTFGGVFTPSILTILGVIMYLRLPYIVGQAGLYQTLGIIAVAHIISVATGLSVSSIATDKRVKAGGTYFMISRSLGLPIGGTLGLALFVGMSFSISLYLIGFAESFLGYWNLPLTIGAIRITGTLVLAAVAVVTMISTALALRTQYYIMAAIALSLLSILFGRHELAPAAPLLQPAAGAQPFIVLFGIFFPAVTGFEAGVSMSGDLRDPRKSIPFGTIAAITVGLLVYMGLAAFFAFTVQADQLSGNPRVLLDMALFSPLVVAGIWGATISSAFGSILGAPRILQATAADGVVPRWFSVGVGRENEPRRALLVACVIAEAGILIGELNAIARIVSMFFITAYGFLNLTAAIESWVSPDFRPEFRVPRAIGLIGAAACFVVMIQLDFLAMVGASTLLFVLYLVLARRQLRLESGDTWEGIWSALARTALHRLDRGQLHRRNWRPNLLLFSGGTTARPHLVQFGRQLTDKRGLLTDIELVAGNGEPRTDDGVQRPADADHDYGVFIRRVRCTDTYSGMEQIASNYGFAGIEPNTVLLGWARNAEDPERFVTLLHRFADRDLNVLLLDFDRNRGWGDRSRIDVWWRLTGNDVSFSLALIRFLTTAEDWRDAGIRFLTVNEGDPALAAAITREMHRALEEHRLEADVWVINNAFEKRSFIDILRAESLEADLTVLAASDLRGDDSLDLVRDTNAVIDTLGTTLLVHASSFFGEPLVRVPRAPPAAVETAPAFTAPLVSPTPISAAVDPAVRDLANRLEHDIEDALGTLWTDFIGRAVASSRSLPADVGAFANDCLVEAGIGDGRDAAASRLVERVLARLDRARSDDSLAQGGFLVGAVDWMPDRLMQFALSAPDSLTLTAPGSTFGPAPGSSIRLLLRQTWMRLLARARNRPVSWEIEPRELMTAHAAIFAAAAMDELTGAVGADAARSIADARRIFDTTAEALDSDPRAGIELVRTAIGQSADDGRHWEAALLDRLGEIKRRTVSAFVADALRVDTRRARSDLYRSRLEARASVAETARIAPQWRDVQPLLVNSFDVSVRLAGLRAELRRASRDVEERVRDAVAGVDRSLERLRAVLEDGDTGSATAVEQTAGFLGGFDASRILEPVRDTLLGTAARQPDTVATLAEETVEAVRSGRFTDAESSELDLRRVVEYLFETALLGPLEHELANVAPDIDAAAEVAREVAQLAAFQRQPGGAGGREAGAVLSPSESGIDRLDREIERLRDRARDLDELVGRRFAEAARRFTFHDVVRVSKRLEQYVRSQVGREVIGGVRDTVTRVRDRAVGLAIRLMYRRSEGALFAGRLRRVAGIDAGTERIRNLLATVSPKPEVLEKLPVFYRELFLGRPTVTSDIRIGFDAELEEAATAVALHRKGRTGAILVIGEAGQGRGTLAALIANQHFRPEQIFRVEPPPGGSIDVRVFNTRLRSALRSASTSTADALAAVPGAALIIQDLNLWWERSPGGMQVVEALARLVTEFSDRVLFLVTCGDQAFRLIDRIQPVEHMFLRIIQCEPFSAEQLQRLVLLRHGATGLRFAIDGRAEEDLSPWRMARLFGALFDYSGGNTGAALSGWIAQIQDVDEDLIELRSPRRPGVDAFEGLSRIQQMLCVQIVVHERLTFTRIQRITRLDKATLVRELRGLSRAGVLVEGDDGTIRLDRFARPHLARFLMRQELLS